MTNRDLKIIIVILCCCLVLTSVWAIVASSLLLAGVIKDDENDIDFSRLTYLALGDSITYGYDSSQNGQAMDKPYCTSVGKLLKLKATYNYGISGSTVSTGVGSYEAMCARYATMRDDADIISVMGGVNDFGRGVPLGNLDDTDTTTFCGALNVLASGLKEKYPDALIFFMTPLKWRGYEGLILCDATLDDFRAAVKAICANYDIPVLDTAVLADYATEYDAAGYTGDGLHPSQKFNTEVLAPLIAEFIRQNYDFSTNG